MARLKIGDQPIADMLLGVPRIILPHYGERNGLPSTVLDNRGIDIPSAIRAVSSIIVAHRPLCEPTVGAVFQEISLMVNLLRILHDVSINKIVQTVIRRERASHPPNLVIREYD